MSFINIITDFLHFIVVIAMLIAFSPEGRLALYNNWPSLPDNWRKKHVGLSWRSAFILAMPALGAFDLHWSKWLHPLIWVLLLTGVTIYLVRSSKSSFLKRWREKIPRPRKPTKYEPWKIGKVTSAVITTALAWLTGFVPILLVVALLSWGELLEFWDEYNLGACLLASVGIAAYLLFDEKGKLRHVLVPVNHAAIPTWLGQRIWAFYWLEGFQVIPWWLGFSISGDPVPKTIYSPRGNIGDDAKKIEKDLGHFTPQEKEGFVFIGERLDTEHGEVASLDLANVGYSANHSFLVKSPYLWQGANNPMGAIMGRFQAGLRMGLAVFHMEDALNLPSVLPWMLYGKKVLFARVAKANCEFVKGDVARNAVGDRIFAKATAKTISAVAKRNFLSHVNSNSDPDCKPAGGFTEAHLTILDLGVDLVAEMLRLGGESKAIAIEDLTPPNEAQNAGAQLAKERAERRSELFQAETRALVTATMATAINTPEKVLAAELSLIEAGKGKLVRGSGENVAAQMAGLLMGNNK